MAVYGGPEITTSGLVLYLDAANKKSYPGTGTTWTDLSGNGNNGTLTNSPSYSSVRNGTLILDGSDDYIITPVNSFPSGNASLTMEAWIRWKGNGTNNVDAIFTYGLDNGSSACPIIGIDASNYIVFEFGSASGSVKAISTASTNIWYYIVATYDKSSTKMYLNGVLQNTTSFSTANINPNGNNGLFAGIGCLYSNFGNVTTSPKRYGTFNGTISSIKLYNRALSASEILNNYNALKGRYASYLTDSDAITYVAAVEAADGQELERSVALAYQDFIVGCKADNIWSAIKASCILMGARTLAGALVSLVGTAPTNNNFVTADYNRKIGLVGNASTKYLLSNRLDTDDQQDSLHLGVYVSTVDVAGGSKWLIGSTNAAANNGSAIGASLYFRGVANAINLRNKLGFIGASRSTSTQYTYRSSSTNTIQINSSLTPPGSTHTIFAVNVGSTPASYTDARLAFYSIGSAVDLALLDTRVSTLYTAIGAAIP